MLTASLSQSSFPVCWGVSLWLSFISANPEDLNSDAPAEMFAQEPGHRTDLGALQNLFKVQAEYGRLWLSYPHLGGSPRLVCWSQWSILSEKATLVGPFAFSSEFLFQLPLEPPCTTPPHLPGLFQGSKTPIIYKKQLWKLWKECSNIKTYYHIAILTDEPLLQVYVCYQNLVVSKGRNQAESLDFCIPKQKHFF